MARLFFENAMKRVSPPWLQRLVGGAVMEALGVPVDTVTSNTAEGVRLRFPNGLNPEALGFIGRERRILRGPGESDTTFASRVLRWWDAHRTRGGPYELLNQLYEFFLNDINPPIDLIANSGLHHDVDSMGNITRNGNIASWSGDGEYPAKWARIFLSFNLSGDTVEVPLLTEGGEPILTEGGDPILATVSIYALSQEEIDIICAVPREWDAAHIDRIYVTLIPFGGLAWGLPPGVHSWGDPGLTWGGGLAVTFVC